MRNSGVDLRTKQAEVEAAKRRAQEMQQRLMEAERCGAAIDVMRY